MYEEIYHITDSTEAMYHLYFMILSLVICAFILYLIIAGKKYVYLFALILILPFSAMMGLITYRNFLHPFLLSKGEVKIVVGEIRQIEREDWEFDRISKATMVVDTVLFAYSRKNNVFRPSYLGETNEHEYLYKGREVRINYITVDTTNYILKLEVKVTSATPQLPKWLQKTMEKSNLKKWY